MYFKYLDYPSIPEELLILNPVVFHSMENFFRQPGYRYYKQYHVSAELNEYLHSILDFDFSPSYQVIRPGLDIHKDVGRKEAVNYLVHTGGDGAILEIYNEDKTKIIFSEIILPRRWHAIDVTKFHTVTDFSSVRHSVTLSHLGKTFLGAG